jgi:SAM-dependent methyltransferase
MDMPRPETYEEGLQHWPYQVSLEAALKAAIKHAPACGKLLDVMCGPGYLLSQIAKQRADLKLCGVDLDKKYLGYGRATYPCISFLHGNALTWQPHERYDVVTCTGSLHHVSYEDQERVVRNIATMVKPGGVVVLTDTYIRDYGSEIERKIAATTLGCQYLFETIKSGAPENVVAWTVEILRNDVLQYEFKTSLKKRLPVIGKHFAKIHTTRTWPATESGYGEYLHICHTTA